MSALVRYGTHRSIAIIILTKQRRIAESTVIGECVGVGTSCGSVLTAGDLVRLYDNDQLMTGNSNYRGIPWFNDSKVRDIVNNFDPALLFDKSRDEGKGVQIVQGHGAPYRNLKGDYGYGVPVTDFIRNGG